MDTWATSAITPEIAGGWVDDPDLFARVFPMDLRPQGHDIIRTWLFYSLARAHVEHGTVPWAHAVIAGWVVDPNRRKLAKSRGDALTPPTPWSGSAPTPSATGRPASGPGSTPPWTRASCGSGAAWPPSCCTPPGSCSPWTGWPPPRPPTPRPGHAGRLAGVVDEATAAFEAYEPARALEAARPSSGPSATTTWSWSRAGPTGRPARPARRRPSAPCAWPWTPWCACSPPCCRSSPRRSGRGGATARCTAAPGRRAARCAPPPASRARTPWPWRRPPPSWPRSAGPRPPPGSRCAPRSAGSRSPTAPTAWPPWPRSPATSAAPAPSPTWPCSTPPTPSRSPSSWPTPGA